MKHCWQRTDISYETRWNVKERRNDKYFQYRCKQCGSEFVTDNVGKLTSKDWKTADPSSRILDDCAEQTIRNVTDA